MCNSNRAFFALIITMNGMWYWFEQRNEVCGLYLPSSTMFCM